MPALARRRMTTRRRRVKKGYRKTRGFRRRDRFGAKLTKQIQPNIAYVRLKYSTSISLDPPLGGSQIAHFRANSIYDPDYSGLGHQPSMTDLYNQLYGHYEVLNTTMVVRPCPGVETAGNALTQIAAYTVGDITDPTPNIESIREFKRGPYMVVNGNSTPNGRLVLRWSKRKWFGFQTPQETGAEFTNNPSACPLLRIHASSVFGSINPVALVCLVDLYMYVRLTRPIVQPQSS